MEKKESIGYLLRTSREKQKLTLEEVANKTKISINMLRNLEANKLDHLPNKTFVKGFVQNYSKCVGIDLAVSSTTLENTYKAQEPEATPDPVAEQGPKEQSLSMEQLEVREKIVSAVHAIFDKRIIIIVAAVFLFAIITKGVISFFAQISNEQVNVAKITGQETKEIKGKDSNLFEMEASKKFLKKNQESNAAKKEAPKEVPKVEKVDNKVDTVVETKPSAQIAAAPKEEVKAQTPQQNLNGKYPYKKFYKISGRMYELSPNAPEVSNNDLLPENIKASVQPGKSNVFVNADKGDTWISYQVDGEKITRYIMKQGRTLLLKGDSVLLFLGNVNATTIFYNNQFVEINSRTGVKSLIFPHELSSNYELPLFPSYKGVLMTAENYQKNMAEKSSDDQDTNGEEE